VTACHRPDILCFISDNGRDRTRHLLNTRLVGVVTLAANVSLSQLTKPGWLTMYLFDRFFRVSVYGVPLNHESKTEDVLSFVFQSVSRADAADTVNMNPCVVIYFKTFQYING
jgi:hypothetical protein